MLTESLDRISSDEEDIAGVYKRLTFADVRMVTLSEGDISELHNDQRMLTPMVRGRKLG